MKENKKYSNQGYVKKDENEKYMKSKLHD